MPYKQRDVLLLPVPFTDLSSQKVRPVIVLSGNDYNEANEDIVIAGVTSQICGRDYEVALNPGHMETGRLPRTSCVRTDKIYALSQEIVRKHYGTVNEAFFAQLLQSIHTLIKLPERT
ncbi:MAG: type II toxin-antitoxin system PemK/MazF family toxin [Oscillospiraceae bacterium]|jgi:mRNA interferase MazF|nr:type II toxin-antitoxin system PemK/MazF family toxin [Oscillospiraceae bacterium]